MSHQKGITFRRIHGRIVPIKLSKQQHKDAAEGVALTSAGVAVGVGAGAVHRQMVGKSIKFSSRGWQAAEKSDAWAKTMLDPKVRLRRPRSIFARAARVRATKNLAAVSERYFKASRKIGRFAPGVRLGGIAAGSLLIGAGVTKLYKAARQDAGKAEMGAIGSSVATGAFITGAYGAPGFRQATKGIYKKAYPVIRALKGRYGL